jgi:hypothetical protein
MIQMLPLISAKLKLMESQDKNPKSPYGIICDNCGKQGLTQQNYEKQMWNADALWKCPNCGDTATWDDDRYERGMDESVLKESSKILNMKEQNEMDALILDRAEFNNMKRKLRHQIAIKGVQKLIDELNSKMKSIAG